jgi:hypothetical protein
MSEPPVVLDLAVGESREFELAGLGTAGYRWTHVIDGPEGIVDLEWVRGTPPGAPQPRNAGSSAPERAIIRGLGVGQTTVRLRQARAWERDQPPLHSHTITINVSEAPGTTDPQSDGPYHPR